MGRLDHHADALGLQHLGDGVGDLRGHLFLDLQPSGIGVDDPRQFADPDHAVIRQVSDVGAADDRFHVMLAVRLETDIAQQHHLVVTLDLFEGALQQHHRIDRVALEVFIVGARHPFRRAGQAFAGWIVAGPAYHGRDRGQHFFVARPRGG